MTGAQSKQILAPRQRRFVDEYLVDCNATRAARAAGYSKSTASQAGWEVLRNPKVAAELERRQRTLAERLEVTLENVISELAKISFANVSDFYKVDAAGRVAVDVAALADSKKSAAISQIEIVDTKEGQLIKFKMADKRAALGDLSRHLGYAPDRLEVTVKPNENRDEHSIRELALAALSLFAEAAHDQEQSTSKPVLINGPTAEGRVEAEATERFARGPEVERYDDDPFDFDV